VVEENRRCQQLQKISREKRLSHKSFSGKILITFLLLLQTCQEGVKHMYESLLLFSKRKQEFWEKFYHGVRRPIS